MGPQRLEEPHDILAQIDEWFHASVAGIRATGLGALSEAWADGLVFRPTPVGDIGSAGGTYETLWGQARSEWSRTGGGEFGLTVTVPCNTRAEVHVPTDGGDVQAPGRAEFVRTEDGCAVYIVPSGTHTFNSTIAA